jgi:CHAD domain-containing protein
MDTGYQQLAAKYIRRQVKQLAEQLDGVRAAEDIEFVHRARVATRRLRAALRMFGECFAKKKIKRWRNAIRQVTSSLGNARDRDVQIECLCGTLSAMNANDAFPGVAHVLVQLEHERERFQRHVVKAVDRLESCGVLREMQKATKKVLDSAVKRDAEGDDPPVAETKIGPVRPTHEACEQIKGHVLRQLGELLQYESCLAEAEDRERHHAMRIAAKRLRYTLEISRAICRGRLNEGVEAIKKLQSLLGDIHDCDVWLDHLDKFAADERDRLVEMFGHAGRFLHLQPGIEYLRKDRQDRRQQTFEELGRYWAELKARRFVEELTEAVDFAGRNGDACAEPG